MRRILLTAGLALGLLIITVGTAGANWWVDLVCTDNPDGPGGGNQWEVVYHEDANDPDTWSTCNMYWITPENLGPADVSMTAGTGGFAGWMVLGIGDDGAAGCSINEMVFTNPNPVDGDLICSITLTNPACVSWDSSNPGFVCNINGGNESGLQMIIDERLYRYGTPVMFMECDICGSWPPTTSTEDATFIGSTEARLNGQVVTRAEECCEITVMGTTPFDWDYCSYVWFEYGTQSGIYPYRTGTQVVCYTDPFQEDISGLESETIYYYSTVEGCPDLGYTEYGNEKTFTTLGATTISQYISGIGPYNFGGQVNVTIDVTTLTTPGTITIIVHPNEFHPAASGDSVKRWFEITSTAVGTFDLTLRYEEGELGSEDEGVLKLWRHTAGGWDGNGPWGTVDTVNNEVTATGITEFSDWVIADEGGPQPPVSEIITIVLVSLGLVGLGVFIWWRRKKHKRAVSRVSASDTEM